MTLTRLVVPAGLVAVTSAIVLGAPGLVAARSEAATVAVSMTDFRFKLSRTTVPRGLVTFKVVNRETPRTTSRSPARRRRSTRPGGANAPRYVPPRGPLSVYLRRAGPCISA